MIELPVYVVFMVGMIVGFVPQMLFRKDMERYLDEDFDRDFFVGLCIDTAIFCVALWIVSWAWNG